MGQNFVKLFSSITDSTIWSEPASTRLVWITMLAMSNAKGEVWASIPGLVNRARVPLADCQSALDTLLSPDRFSRTKEEEGRRIREIEGGWQIINYIKFREIKDEAAQREAKRVYMQNKRAKEKNVHVHINADKATVVTKKVE
jgi:hypothetical protein